MSVIAARGLDLLIDKTNCPELECCSLMRMSLPGSLRKEHEELHDALARALEEEGPIGDAARTVAEKLFPHFEKEESALAPLGALTLSGEERIARPEEIVERAQQFSEDLPIMLEEHVQIAIALEVLAREAERAGRMEYVRFSEKLLHHAQMEEEIFYPAALLIGAYVRERLRTEA